MALSAGELSLAKIVFHPQAIKESSRAFLESGMPYSEVAYGLRAQLVEKLIQAKSLPSETQALAQKLLQDPDLQELYSDFEIFLKRVGHSRARTTSQLLAGGHEYPRQTWECISLLLRALTGNEAPAACRQTLEDFAMAAYVCLAINVLGQNGKPSDVPLFVDFLTGDERRKKMIDGFTAKRAFSHLVNLEHVRREADQILRKKHRSAVEMGIFREAFIKKYRWEATRESALAWRRWAPQWGSKSSLQVFRDGKEGNGRHRLASPVNGHSSNWLPTEEFVDFRSFAHGQIAHTVAAAFDSHLRDLGLSGSVAPLLESQAALEGL